MATTTKPNRYPTMTDLMDRLDPDGEMADVVEVLNETNEMLEDIVWEEANNKLSHKTTVRSGLPSVIWRKLNYGVPPSKSKTKQITDTCGMLEALAVIDKKLAQINGMKESWRASEEAPFVESMSQEFQRALLYGDSSKDPEKIMGFMPRFSTITASKAENAVNLYVDRSKVGEANTYANLSTAISAADSIDKSKNQVIITVAGGTYDLNDTITFKSTNGGSSEYPLIIKAEDGKQVIFEAGKRMSGTKITNKDKQYSRFPNSSKNHIFKI